MFFCRNTQSTHIGTHLCNRGDDRIRKPYPRRLWTAWSRVPWDLTFLWVWLLGGNGKRQRSRYSFLRVIPYLATHCRADSSTGDHSGYQAAFQERKFWKPLPVLSRSGLGVVKSFNNYSLALTCSLFHLLDFHNGFFIKLTSIINVSMLFISFWDTDTV